MKNLIWRGLGRSKPPLAPVMGRAGGPSTRSPAAGQMRQGLRSAMSAPSTLPSGTSLPLPSRERVRVRRRVTGPPKTAPQPSRCSGPVPQIHGRRRPTTRAFLSDRDPYALTRICAPINCANHETCALLCWGDDQLMKNAKAIAIVTTIEDTLSKIRGGLPLGNAHCDERKSHSDPNSFPPSPTGRSLPPLNIWNN